MFKKILAKLEGEISGQIAFNYTREISRFHRIQSSPGIRAAVEYVANEMKAFGLNSEIHSYPADGQTYFWSCNVIKEWDCKGAELRLVEPSDLARPLALWEESKSILIERSHPTPAGGCEVGVVVLENGEEEEHYLDLDVSAKIVMTKGNVARVYDLAIKRRGAVGIIYDGMRNVSPVRKEGDLDDALDRGRSGGWSGDDTPCFAFVLSPRKGRWLREIVAKRSEEGKSVKVWVNVDARFYEGTMENAIASIPGESDEEVVVMAHICHPQGYANDNASGCGAVMEVARALQKLISTGVLPKPRRTIRFTLVPEMQGTHVWLADNEETIPKMVAGVNLDMVGENQELCGGPFSGVKTPDSMPSFVNALVQSILDVVMMRTDEGNESKKPIYKYGVTPFSAGSDHFIYSDPSVGVPCVQLSQSPDKFYHSTFDTMDKVNPEMLRRASLIAATYTYFIANSGPEEEIWLASEVVARFKQDLVAIVQRSMTTVTEESDKKTSSTSLKIEERIDYLTENGIEALRSIRKLVAGDNESYEELETRLIDEMKTVAMTELELSRYTTNKLNVDRPSPHKEVAKLSDLEVKASVIIPRRVHRGPTRLGGYEHRPLDEKLSPDDRDKLWKLEKEHKKSLLFRYLAQYWANGERSILEISRLLELETSHKDLEFLMGYLEILRKVGIIELD